MSDRATYSGGRNDLPLGRPSQSLQHLHGEPAQEQKAIAGIKSVALGVARPLIQSMEATGILSAAAPANIRAS